MSNNANVGGIEYTATIELQEFIRGQREIDQRLGQIEKAGDRLDATMTTVAKAVAGAVAAIQLGNLVSDLIKTQRQFDVMNASLKTLTGSQEAANAAFDKLKTFAATTPYDLEQVVGAFTKMKALGLDPSERALTSFGNTASAMGKSLNQMVEAVADAATGEFERLKEFGIKASKQGDEVTFTFQGVETTIKNSSDKITEYLTNLGEVNFAGAMAERMNTLDGQISNLQDSLQDLFREINASGFGEAVAKSVQIATEAIQEMTKSVKAGELTEYFDGVKKVLPVVEVAVLSLAGAIASRLLPALITNVAQFGYWTYSVGAAAIAARGFAGAVALMGGPIGIAITALGLLALNWDKVSASADNAAGINERAAQRIKNALAKSGEEQRKDLQATRSELENQLRAAENVEVNFKKWGTGTPKQIDAARERVAALKKALDDVAMAQRSGGGGGGRGSVNPDPVAPDAPKPKGATDTTSKAQKFKFDAEAYLAGLKMANLKELDLIEAQEAEKLRRNAQLQEEQKITAQQAEEAKTAILAKGTQQREALYQRERDAAMAAAEQKRKEIEQAGAAEQAAKDRANGRADAIIGEGDPAAKIQEQAAAKQAALDEDLAAGYLLEEKWAQATIELHAQKEEQLQRLADEREAAERQKQLMMVNGAAQGFGAMADIIGTFAGKQSAAYKTMFAVSKAFSIASAIMNVSVGMSEALKKPWPLNLAAAASVAAAGASIISQVRGASFGGGRQYGGPISEGKFYRVNETGQPEMYTASTGQQYMLPNKSGKVTPANKLGGGEGGGSVAAQNVSIAPVFQGVQMPDGWFAVRPEAVADALKVAYRDGHLAGFKG